MIYKRGFVTLLFTVVFSGILALGLILLKAVGNYRQATHYALKELELLVCCQEFTDYAATYYLRHKNEIEASIQDKRAYQQSVVSPSTKDVRATIIFNNNEIAIVVFYRDKPVKRVYIVYACNNAKMILSNAYIE